MRNSLSGFKRFGDEDGLDRVEHEFALTRYSQFKPLVNNIGGGEDHLILQRAEGASWGCEKRTFLAKTLRLCAGKTGAITR